MADKIRVLVVDDHIMFTEAIGLMLRGTPGIEFLGAATTGEQAIEITRRERPDVLLMDLNLPGMDGIEATRAIRSISRATQVIVITGLEDAPTMARAVEAGASGFILKTKAVEELVDVIKRAASGEMTLPPGSMVEILANLRQSASARDRGVHHLKRLTSRELGILQLISEGYSNGRIASTLFISPLTVQSHVRNVLRKLEVHSKLEAVTFALRYGAIDVIGSVEHRGSGPGARAN